MISFSKQVNLINASTPTAPGSTIYLCFLRWLRGIRSVSNLSKTYAMQIINEEEHGKQLRRQLNTKTPLSPGAASVPRNLEPGAFQKDMTTLRVKLNHAELVFSTYDIPV